MRCHHPRAATGDDSALAPHFARPPLTLSAAAMTEAEGGDSSKAGPSPLHSKVIVHPIVLLSVVDHYNRLAKDTKKRSAAQTA